MKKLAKITTVCVGLCYGSAHAMGYPVFDLSVWMQAIKTYNESVQMLEQAKNSVSLAKNQLTSLTGSYGWGSMLDSASQVQKRSYGADNWQDALKGLSGGNNTRYESLLSAYKKAHPSLSGNQYRVTNTKSQSEQYSNHVNTVNAVAATSQMEYEKINEYIKNIHQIASQIDSSKNNGVKSAIDLNSRMAEQVAYLQAAMIRLNAVKTNLSVSEAEQELQSNNNQIQFLTKKS